MKKITKYKITIVFLWILLVSASGVWNGYESQKAQEQLYLETARSYFALMVDTRSWNASLGGLYARVSDAIQPNPYLQVPDRDLLLPNGVMLTLINPAYMTRMIAEFAQRNNNVLFHITSLNPIRPENAPTTWEAAALQSFENSDQAEFINFDRQSQVFYYMAPLIIQENCLVCHEQQGYKIGDIRGGISVSFKTRPAAIQSIIFSHITISLMGVLGIWTFATQLANAFEQLEAQTHLDGLTQIHNRAYFDDYFHREYMRSRRDKSPLSVILCDVDFFKPYNDTYGHQMGDKVLIKIAAVLQNTIKRPGDIVARFGGEEFVVILPDTPHEAAYALAELLRAAVEQLRIPHKNNKISSFVTISLGVWTYQGEEIKLETVFDHVDVVPYHYEIDG